MDKMTAEEKKEINENLETILGARADLVQASVTLSEHASINATLLVNELGYDIIEVEKLINKIGVVFSDDLKKVLGMPYPVEFVTAFVFGLAVRLIQDIVKDTDHSMEEALTDDQPEEKGSIPK